MLKKAITIIYDLIVIGKTAASDIQLSADKTTARRIRAAIAECNLDRVQRIVMRDQITLTEDDIIDVAPAVDGVVVSADFIVKFRQTTKELVRCRRSKTS